MEMLIAESERVSVSPGDFRAEVRGETLLLPPEVKDILQSFGVFTAEQLFSFVEAIPEPLATALGWTPEQLQEAVMRLRVQLFGALSHTALYPASDPSPLDLTWGASFPGASKKTGTDE